MKNTPENKNKTIQYLYGNLSEKERNEFEELLFTDENAGVFVEDIENDLIDEYVRGELEFEQKREFEKKYLTTKSRHERVALARTLQTELFEERKETIVATEERTGIWQSLAGLLKAPNLALAGGLATILLLALIGGIWFSSQTGGNENIARGSEENNNRGNITPIQEDTPKEVSPTPEETPLEKPEVQENKSSTDRNNDNANKKENVEQEKPKVNKNKKKPTPTPIKKKPVEQKKPKVIERKPTTFVASLLPPLRSNQTPLLKIPASTKTVRLQLFDNFGQKYKKFVIELNGGGTSMWGQEINASKKGSQKSITINIPNSIFKSGNYEIAVSGVTEDGSVEEINFYNFIVEKEKGKKE